MIIRVEKQDFKTAGSGDRLQDGNPIVRAVKRATRNAAGLKDYEWIVGRMPVFDEESHRTGQSMPQLYVLSQADPLTTDFYVLPPLPQALLQQWIGGERVSPIEFELPLQIAEEGSPGQVFGLPASMLEGLKTNLSRLSEEANREIDVESLRRGLVKLIQEGNKEIDLQTVKDTVAKLIQEGNKEIDLQPVKEGVARLIQEGNKEIDLQPVKDGVAKLNTYGQMPVSVIGREIGRLLVTPIGLGERNARDDKG